MDKILPPPRVDRTSPKLSLPLPRAPIPTMPPNICAGHIKHKRPTVDGQNLAHPPGGPHEPQGPPPTPPSSMLKAAVDVGPGCLARWYRPVHAISTNIKHVRVSGETRLETCARFCPSTVLFHGSTGVRLGRCVRACACAHAYACVCACVGICCGVCVTVCL